ncbi:T9SS type A sorting domain-containing protein, partial [Aquiflexum sp. LQ15W]|uniref:LamG-like jellyroll fold domain-containing protein n=1 Tax=Cognataquiflexum nitidum TaxID=2922272 RepID=UPI001F141942
IHVAATYDGTTSRIYINGVENISASYGPINIGTTSGNLVIGALGSIQRFNGALDDIRLYGRALSAGEISQLANSSQAFRILGTSDKINSENKLGGMTEDTERQREEPLEKPSYLYPNPVQDILNLMVFGKVKSPINIMIFDSKGVLITEREFETNNGVLTIDVNSLNLKPGIHILLVNKEGNLETLKFIKK